MIIARDKTASRYTTDAGQSAAILHFSVVYCTMKATNVKVPRAAKKLFPKKIICCLLSNRVEFQCEILQIYATILSSLNY